MSSAGFNADRSMAAILSLVDHFINRQDPVDQRPVKGNKMRGRKNGAVWIVNDGLCYWKKCVRAVDLILDSFIGANMDIPFDAVCWHLYDHRDWCFGDDLCKKLSFFVKMGAHINPFLLAA
jgi:hypothetical protein